MARILIVEDDLLQVMDLETLFKSRSHTICGVARTGEGAILLANTRRPDIIIMDVKLAGWVDGIAAAESIMVTRPCGLIFFTGYADGETKARITVLRPEALLLKPCASEMIIDALDRAIKRRGIRVQVKGPLE